MGRFQLIRDELAPDRKYNIHSPRADVSLGSLKPVDRPSSSISE